MQNKSAKTIFIFFILFNLFISAYAQSWEPVTQTGEWVVCERTYVEKEGANEGYAEWQYNFTSFSGYWIELNVTWWENWRDWWDFEDWCWFGIWIKISTEDNSSLWTKIENLGKVTIFGAVNTREFKYTYEVNATHWDDKNLKYYFSPNTLMFYGIDYWWWQPSNFQLFIFNQEDQLYWRLYYIIPTSTKCLLIERIYNFTLSGNGNITLIYRHAGHGKIKANITDSFTLPTPPQAESESEKYRAGSGFFDIFRKLSQLDYLGIINVLFICVATIINIVAITLPFFGILLLFWILDVVVTAITTGQIRLIGEAFLKIYDYIRGVWQTLVNIADTIWDFLTFWS